MLFLQPIQALPGLAPYAATKAGLQFWSDALRVELKKYGVEVVSFIPGSQVMCTNITARQVTKQLFFTIENIFFEFERKIYKKISSTGAIRHRNDDRIYR